MRSILLLVPIHAVLVCALSLRDGLKTRIAPRSLDFVRKDKLHIPPREWIKKAPAPSDHTIHLKIGTFILCTLSSGIFVLMVFWVRD